MKHIHVFNFCCLSIESFGYVGTYMYNDICVYDICVSVLCVCVCVRLCVFVCVCVTGFSKTDQIVTLGLFHFVGPVNGYTHTLHIHNTYTVQLPGLVDWSAFLERVLPTL